MGNIAEIKFHDGELSRALGRVIELLRNPEKTFEEMAIMMEKSMRKNIDEGGRYSGDPHLGRGGNTKFKKLKTRVGGLPLKTSSPNRIYKSITHDVRKDGFIVGTSEKIGAINNMGAPNRSRGGTLPARPFVVVQPQDLKDMKKLIASKIKNAWK